MQFSTLRLPEETILLLLDDESGDIQTAPQRSLALTLAGSILVDLFLERKIDSDQRRITVIDATPTGDNILDPILADIAHTTQSRTAQDWLQEISVSRNRIYESLIERLTEKGILGSDDPGFVALEQRDMREQRCPVPHGQAQSQVQRRLTDILLEGRQPDERDVALIKLVESCRLFEAMLGTPTQGRRGQSFTEEAEFRLFNRTLSCKLVPKIKERIASIIEPCSTGQPVVDAIRSTDLQQLVRPARSAPRKPIPSVPGLPLIGNAINLMGDVRQFLTEQYLNHGPVFRVTVFRRRLTVLAGIEANNFINRHGKDLLISRGLWMDLDRELGARRSIHSMDGPEHFRMRRVERPGYSRAAGEDRIDEIYQVARDAVRGWPIGRSMQVWKCLARIVTSQLGVIGADTTATQHLDDLRTYMHALLMSHVAHTRPEWIMRLPHIRRARKRMEALYAEVVDAHDPSNRQGRKRNLVDDLVELHRSDPEFLPERDLRVSVLGPFVAGLDTVTGTCSFMLYALLKQPALLARMQAECDHLFARGSPTPDAIRELDVTHRVALETMRMYPVAPAAIRTAARAFEFAGHRIPIGETVLLGTTVPHYLPEVFPNPEVFDIDRYAPGRNEHRQAGALVPFGIGSHHCLGASLAEWQVMLTTATILHHSRIALDPPDYSLRLMFKPNPMPRPSFRIRVTEHR